MKSFSPFQHYLYCITILYCLIVIPKASAIVINTPVVGDFTAVPNQIYDLDTTIGGNFILPSGSLTLNLTPAGRITRTLFIDSNGGNIQITLDPASRIGGGIIERGNNTATTMNILGTVDSGIQLSSDGMKIITVSGLFAEVGLITLDTRSIIGSINTASIYTFNNGAIINGSLTLGNQNDTVLVDNARTGAILSLQGNKNITIDNGSLVSGDIDSADGNDTITVRYSTVSGNILTGATGNDTIRIVGSLVRSAIILGAGLDTLSLEEASSIGGNVTATDTLVLTSTFGSSIQGNLQVLNSLTLSAPSGILVSGTTTSGADSVYTLTRSTFTNNVFINGNTTITALNTAFSNSIILGSSGNINIDFTNSRISNTLNLAVNNNTTTLSFNTNSSTGDILFGSGLNTLFSNNSKMGAITASNLTLDAIDSTFNSTLTITNRFEATFQNSIIADTISTQAGTHPTTLIANNSAFNRNILLLGATTLQLDNSTVLGTAQTGANDDILEIQNSTMNIIQTGAGNDTLLIQNTSFNSIMPENGNNIITITHSTFQTMALGNNNNIITIANSQLGEIQAPLGQLDPNILFLQGSVQLKGAGIAIGNGEIFLEDTLYIARENAGTPSIPVTIQGEILHITDNANIILTPQTLGSITYLQFDTVNYTTTKPLTTLHVNSFNGIKNSLDISGINSISNNKYTVQINGLLGIGSALERIEDVIIANPNVIPRTPHEYVLLNGNLYTLEENTAKPNVYDLVYKAVSPTNYGYAAAHSGMRSFNTTIWHSMLSHFQEEAQMFRDKQGRQRESEGIFSAVSLWARGSYGIAKITPGFNKPNLEETSSSILAGLDFANIAIATNASIMFQVFAGVGTIETQFEKLALGNITFSNDQLGITAGLSLGVQQLTHNRRGKLYIISTLWYSLLNNALDSNLFIEKNKWINQSINIATSLGYSIYLQKMVITPQIAFSYFHTFKKTYISPDMNKVTFAEESRMVGSASMLLGYASSVGITPYIRGGIEIPLFKGKGSGSVSVENSTTKYSYDTTSFNTDVTLGLAYRGGFERFAITLSAEVSAIFGDKEGVEAFVQAGFQF